mgnify:CR=1 FL=1
MGNCCSQRIEYLFEPKYLNKATLQIKDKDSLGRVVGYETLKLSLNPAKSEMVNLTYNDARITGCVIPNQDPRGEYSKPCQDDVLFVEGTQACVVVLFDGHGREGEALVSFCKEYMRDYFLKHQKTFQSNAEQALCEMIETCDKSLEASGIPSELSGTTCVVVYIDGTSVFVASLGDSRAVLATLPKEKSYRSENLKPQPYKRPVLPSKILQPVALTVDQKPNQTNEMKRILDCGGVVRALSDSMGNPVGPYRVWLKNANLPGLAMSRSIGDKCAKRVGVISTPLCHSFPYYAGTDHFIVVASDGVWDVMENFEVINFVERFRKKCQQAKGKLNYPSSLSNSTIARLLCEEARYRWFSILEEEDVMIDDISAVVIEFEGVSPITETYEEPQTYRNVEKKVSWEEMDAGGSAWSNAVRNDPNRGSVAASYEDSEILQTVLEINHEINEESYCN